MNSSPLLVRARALTGFAELVREFGGDAEGLLHEVGLSAQMLVRPEATISMPGAVALLENAASQLAVPGLWLAPRTTPGLFGTWPHRTGCPSRRHRGQCTDCDRAQSALPRRAHLAADGSRAHRRTHLATVRTAFGDLRRASSVSGDVLLVADPDSAHAERGYRCRLAGAVCAPGRCSAFPLP